MQNPVRLEPTHHYITALKCEIFSPDAFETPKYQNLPMSPYQMVQLCHFLKSKGPILSASIIFSFSLLLAIRNLSYG